MLYVNNGAQKTYFFLFWYWRPGVRISTLRPKKKQTAPAVVCSFFRWRGCRKLHFCAAKRSSHIPSEDRLARLSGEGRGYLQKEYLHTSTTKGLSQMQILERLRQPLLCYWLFSIDSKMLIWFLFIKYCMNFAFDDLSSEVRAI